MSAVAGVALLLVAFLFGMDMAFDRIPSCVQNGVTVDGADCMVENTDYAELTFYDPTLPEPQRWYASNILLQFGHPMTRKVPVTWMAWRVGWKEEPIGVWAYHNEFPTLGNQAHWPILDPPIHLSDGSFATTLAQLEQVRTK